MVDTWLNHSIYGVLERIGNFSGYFVQVCKWFAAICFFMALLMAVIKIFLGIADAREQVIKLTVTTCFYFILMYVYPIAMKSILPFSMNLGYGAVFYTAQANVSGDPTKMLSLRKGTQAQFYKWIGDNTNNIFTTTEIKDYAGNVTGYQLNMNIVSADNGYFDFNKIFTFILAFLKIGFMMLPKITLFDLEFTFIVSALFYVLALMVVFVCLVIVVVNYITCLMDYFALMGFGILMIPLSLWDGTKSYTEKLYGSIGAIIIKLMVISAFMYLSIMVVIDLFAEMYCISGTTESGIVIAIDPKNTPKFIELSVTLCVQGFLMHTLVTNTEKIAGFLNGGSPSMSFGDAAKGMAGMIAAGAMAKGASRAMAGAIGNTVDAGVRSIASGKNAKVTGNNVFGSVMKSLGSSIARSTVGAVTGAPENAKNALKSLANATGMTRAIGGEGFTTGKDFGGTGGGSIGGEGYTGGNSDNNNGKASTVNNENNGNTGSNDVNANNSGETLYGDVGYTSDGGLANYGDSLKSKADSMSQSSNALDRRRGAVLGTAGAVLSNLSNYKNERYKGNVLGNKTYNAIADGIKQGVKGDVASRVNAGGGMTISVKKGTESARTFGATQKIKSKGASAKVVDSSDGSKTKMKEI